MDGLGPVAAMGGLSMGKLKLLSLFSGIGGFELGLERSGGFETVAQSEIDPYASRVLKKHWLEVPNYGDIKDITATRLRADGIRVDAICGGFPCQDISAAGKGAGIEGERSGLWSEYARLIGELRPRVVFVENVSALLSRGLDVVLGDLASIGYDAEWHCIPASAIGAPHRRDRIWIIAYPNHTGECANCGTGQSGQQSKAGDNASGLCETVAYPKSDPSGSGSSKAGQKREGQDKDGNFTCNSRGVMADCLRGGFESGSTKSEYKHIGAAYAQIRGQWAVEPQLGRVANGIPNWSHRIKCLGNAVVPQIPELLGRAYLESIEWGQAA